MILTRLVELVVPSRALRWGRLTTLPRPRKSVLHREAIAVQGAAHPK